MERLYTFSNLSNAVKYTPDNGDIVISTEKMDNEVTIAIKNSGKGILKKISVRFSRRAIPLPRIEAE